ncbi:C-type lectin lectoxin-Thr1-like [Strix uralensis]|uniref:C-type lectin lectoxin-Thr1-like n=1 Tax=Strix uralensis TaxID=36305 RepID=UPI003DA705C2
MLGACTWCRERPKLLLRVLWPQTRCPSEPAGPRRWSWAIATLPRGGCVSTRCLLVTLGTSCPRALSRGAPASAALARTDERTDPGGAGRGSLPTRDALATGQSCSREPSAAEMRPRPLLPPCLLGCLLLLAWVGGALGGLPHGGATAKTRTANCPPNWLYFRGSCYGYFIERRTWAEAEEECQRYGPVGRLASIHSQGGSRVLARYVSKQRARDNVWIGLQDEEHTRQWKWSDNSVFDYKRWDKGQPNNLCNKEDCVVLDKASGFERWHDYPCNYKFPFLCRHQL